ncbi:MAG: two-component regulator propeller domain-containing protein [Marinilabiliaceae bacterium]|nr:two-component regulator propeller domain-containing protein [Marinilabiliaceae bacterium]
MYPNDRFTHLTINNGLSQSSGKAIVQDEYGYMWFGTADGLNRYDGYSIVKYYNSPNSKFSLPSNDISYLYSNPYDSVLWVGTQDKGPALYLRERNNFITFSATLERAGYSEFGHITGIVALNRDTVLISTNNRGLYLYSAADSLFSRFDLGTSPGINNIKAMLKDSRSRIWIGTGSGLFTFNQSSLQTGSKPDLIDSGILGSRNITALAEDSRGYLYIGTHTYGVIRFHPSTGEATRLIFNENAPGLAGKNITAVLVDKMNNLYASTSEGLYKYIAATENISLYSDDPNNQESLNDDNISVLYEDRSGILWIGTFLGGINILDPSRNRFSKYNDFLFSVQKDQSTNNVMSIVKDKNNSVWVSTLNGLYELTEDYFNREQSDLYIRKRFDKIQAGLHYNREAGLFYTYQGDLYRIRNNESTQLLENIVRQQTGLDFPGFSSALTDSDGIIWFAANNELLRFDPDAMMFRRVQYTDQNGELIPLYILSMVETYDGSIYLGTYSGELYRFDRHLGTFTGLIESGVYTDIIGYSKIFSLAESKPGVLWIGTNCGLYCYKYETGELSRYLIEDGLSNNLVYGILVDPVGKIWCSTNFGVSVYDPSAGEFMNYTHNDGLQSNEFNQNSFYMDNDGMFYMGGIDGMNIFDPLSIEKNTYLPPVYIESMEIQYQDVTPDDYPEIFSALYGNGKKSISLRHRQSTFSFEYSALNFSQPERNTYEYMLEGYDDAWIDAGNRRIASYTHVKPGAYTFMLRAYNSDGIMCSETASLAIEIIPPYWQRKWFISVFILMVSASVYLVFYLRIRSVRKQNELLERRVNEKTEAISLQSEKISLQNQELKKINQVILEKNRQLNDQHIKITEQRDDLMRLTDELQEANQSRLRFFTTISHEFRTPLTLIINPLKGLMDNLGDMGRDTVTRQLRTIYGNASKLLVLINQLLDFRKGEVKGWDLEISEFDFVSFVSETVGMFSDFASQRGIDLRLESSHPSILLRADQLKIEKVVLNLISNALKHTPEKGSIEVKVRTLKLESGDRGAEFSIEDSGPGIAPGIRKHIFERFGTSAKVKGSEFSGSGLGLSIAKRFIELHEGNIDFETGEKGTRFFFQLSLDKLRVEEKASGLKGDIFPIDAESLLSSLEAYIPLNVNNVETGEDIRRNKLLLIEDDETLASYLEDVLSLTYRIIRTDNAAGGMQMALSVRPDVIVSDVMLPDFDGFELCRKLKDDFHTAHIPVVLLTALSGRENELKGLKSGADEFITKPFDLEQLLLRLKNLIEMRPRIISSVNRDTTYLTDRKFTDSEDKTFFEKVVGIVEDNISDSNFNVDELCAGLDISHPQVYRRVKAITGLSISEFIRNIRLKKAAKLLLTGDFKINEVAYQVGFSDANYFTKCFTKLYGQTPRSFLRNTSI